MERLTRPERFGIVAPQVYRSSVFQTNHFTFIEQLRLRTIVHLSPEVTLRAVSSFIEEKNIRLIHLGIKFWRTGVWKPISEDLVKEALEIILDARNHPILIMCTSGVHQTGTVVGCLRRMQRLSFSFIIDELRIFASQTHTRYANENFIECFDVDLVTLPENVPMWFVAWESKYEDMASGYNNLLKNNPKAEQPAYLRYYMKKDCPLVVRFLKDLSDEELQAVLNRCDGEVGELANRIPGYVSQVGNYTPLCILKSSKHDAAKEKPQMND